MSEVIVKERLCQLVSRIERLEEDKRNVQEDLKEVFAEAKGEGFDVKILKTVIKLRRQDKHDLAEQEELLALYRDALEI